MNGRTFSLDPYLFGQEVRDHDGGQPTWYVQQERSSAPGAIATTTMATSTPPAASNAPPAAAGTSSRTAVSTVTGEEVQILILKLDQAKDSLLSPLPLVDLSGSSSSLGGKKGGAAPPKHLRQTDSICRHLQRLGLLSPDPLDAKEKKDSCCQPCYIELGCGTAKLSDHISQIVHGNCSHILLDKKDPSSFKAVRLLDGTISQRQSKDNNVFLQRKTTDLQNIDVLSELIGNQKDTANNNYVFVSKHLCGAAADYAIQGLQKIAEIPKKQSPLPPLVVATCCHHRCDAQSFCNLDFFRHLGFTDRDFEALHIVSSWSSIKVPSQKKRKTAADVVKAHEEETTSDYVNLPPLPSLPLPQELPDCNNNDKLIPSEVFEREFSREDKAALGKRCKLALDTARGHALKRMGYNKVQFVRYTTLSLEDTLMIAT